MKLGTSSFLFSQFNSFASSLLVNDTSWYIFKLVKINKYGANSYSINGFLYSKVPVSEATLSLGGLMVCKGNLVKAVTPGCVIIIPTHSLSPSQKMNQESRHRAGSSWRFWSYFMKSQLKFPGNCEAVITVRSKHALNTAISQNLHFI